jgi:hypothetical protein
METNESYVGKMEEQFKHFGTKLDELAGRADATGAQIQKDFRKGVDELKAEYKSAHAKLEQLKVSSAENWETFKTGVEKAWAQLDITFRKMAQ